MKITNGKDFWAGIMFMGFGLFFLIASRDYQMGSAVRMGPAYFPSVLGGMLAVLGLMVLVRGFISKIRHSLAVIPFRLPLFIAGLVVAAIAWFGFDWIKGLGSAGTVIQYILNAASLLLIVGSIGSKAPFVITVAVVAFGYLLKPLGLVLATAVLIIGSAWGGHEFRMKETLISFVVLSIFSVLVFFYGLGLPINIWPSLD